MQSHHEVTKPFRKQDPKDIVKYICNSNMDDTRRKFRNMYNIEINTYIVVGEEPTVNIKENVPVPCALLYLKDRRYYAMGVVDKAGEIDIDCTYQLTVPIVITYTLWGTYQRIPWTYMEILQSINWRIDFMKTPKYLNRPDKVLFEKSRWMMFAFWSEDLDKLIKLELELMDKIKTDMQDIGKVELHPKFDGKQMIMVIQPL